MRLAPEPGNPSSKPHTIPQTRGGGNRPMHRMRVQSSGSYSLSTNLTLNAGTPLGPYEILSPLGAGGMGEVYKAKDTRLERTVAVKVLPSHLSASADSR